MPPGAYLLYDSRDGKPPLEFRAQNMVLFSPNTAATSQPATSTAPATQPATPTPITGDLTQSVTGVYLEGDVSLDQGDQIMVRAERVYYDFTSQRAIMLDATLATVDQTRDLPIYTRAHDIRQLQRERVCRPQGDVFDQRVLHAALSHWCQRSLSARCYVAGGDACGRAWQPARFRHGRRSQWEDLPVHRQGWRPSTRLGVPIFYWPYLAADTSQTELPLKAIRISHSKAYGLSLLTDWNLFSLLGQIPPQGFKADLNLDYYGSRGPAAGVKSAVDWKTDDDHGIARTLRPGTTTARNRPAR